MQGPGYPAGSYPPDPNVPQPPDAQTQTLYPQAQAQQQAGPTLGQANGDPSGLPPGNPYLEQFLQTHAVLDQIAKPLKQPLVPPQPGPGLLESLGTFGIANLKHIADENTRREENYKRHQKNLAIDQHTNDMALKATDAQATASGLMGRANLAQQGMQLRLLQFQQQLQDYAHKLGREQVADQVPLPKTPGETRLREAQGLEQDPAHPNKMRLIKNPQTGAYEPPKPGSAGQTALDAVGGGGADTGAGPSGPRPGESPADYADRKQRENAIATKMGTPTSASRTKAEAAPKVLHLLDQLETDLKGVNTGPISSRYHTARVALGMKDPAFMKYQATAGLAQTALMQMHTGSRSSELLLKHFVHMLDTSKQGPENMQATIDTIREYANSVANPGGSGGSATSDTPTSGGPPSTLSGTKPTAATGLTPGGIRFREVQ